MSGNYCDVCHRFVPIDAEHQCEGPRASIAGAQPARAAPNGYKLVPLEPTEAMLYAMAECDGYQRGDRDHPMLTQWEDYWRMALDAAPAAQPADSAMEVLTELLQLHEHCPNIKTCDLADYNEWLRADTAAWDRARALVAKETSHG